MKWFKFKDIYGVVAVNLLVISAFFAPCNLLADEKNPLLTPARNMLQQSDFPILFISSQIRSDYVEGEIAREISGNLKKMNFSVIETLSLNDGITIYDTRKDLSCIILDWDSKTEKETDMAGFIRKIRDSNKIIPIFLMTDKVDIKDITNETFSGITGYIWETEDSVSFISGTIKFASASYIKQIMPPLFSALVNYVNDYKYNWAVPGHSGGSAFLKSPAGTAFLKFFGENIFRADVSTTDQTIGSVLEHSGAVGESERQAAKIFGSDMTYYVLNGTSTSNKIVFHATVTPGKIVLVDRNCHKSVMHSIIMTRSIPVYLCPTRNDNGIIGPIPLSEFNEAAVAKKMASSPLIAKDNPNKKVTLSVVTNSTYDGLCYNVPFIKDQIENHVKYMQFDEAWYSYPKFYPQIYGAFFGMSDVGLKPGHPPVFTTQSTHKLLAAFSQGSMIHIKQGGKLKIDPDRFNEAFMMHTTTSPFDPLLASLDVSAKMMEGDSGRSIMTEIIEDAIGFRKVLARIHRDKTENGSWFFNAWQPDKVDGKNFEDIDGKVLMSSHKSWLLNPGDKWHGFKNIDRDYILLDPIKVTITSPGINEDGSMAENGIPASIVTAFLEDVGVLVEKVNYYSFLILFSPGVTKGKSGTTVAKLLEFKKLYDSNAPIAKAIPSLAVKYPESYGNTGLKDFCQKMHSFLKERKVVGIMSEMYSAMPLQKMLPAEAYDAFVDGQLKEVEVKKLVSGDISAAMLVPYPPGIPVIMPGECFTDETKKIIEYLSLCEDYDNAFPGFSNHIHGIRISQKDGKSIYSIDFVAK